jgi:hypothetical protein
MDDADWPLSCGAIDWSRPWFASWREPGQRVAARIADGFPLPDALNREPDAPLRFVVQEALPAGQPYERFVRDSGTCPVRPGLHDFFNGVVWLRLPRSKAALNRLQVAEIDSRGVGGVRGPVRDGITVFDENGALLDAPAALWEALLAREWRRLFIDLRPLWAQARVLVVGHAMLEKLLQPRKELTAHVWRLQCPILSMAEVDSWLAGQISREVLAGKPFTPLPLLGVPDWSSSNQNFSFYDDSLIFRPAGRKELNTTGPVTASRP